jgi:hypothetical protein
MPMSNALTKNPIEKKQTRRLLHDWPHSALLEYLPTIPASKHPSGLREPVREVAPD